MMESRPQTDEKQESLASNQTTRVHDRLPTSRAAGSRLKRVVIVISELRAGGAERVVVHLAGALLGFGLQPTVICLQRKGVLADELASSGVPLVALESLRGYDFAAIARMAALFRRLRPDVINVHDRYSLPYVFLANRMAGHRPLVFSCHGLLAQVAAEPRWCEQVAMRDVQAVTAVSAETAREYSRILNWRGELTVVPNGVPMPREDGRSRGRLRSELGITERDFVFLAVGNIKPEKGFEDLLEAASILRARPGQKPFAVLSAGGTTDEACRRSLEEALRRLNLGGTVRFLGYRRDTSALYSAADAFVMSSRKEGLPMVLLEAMAAGLPVVATRVGGIPDVIETELNGLLISPSAPVEMADAMERLLSGASFRAEIGARARDDVRRAYGVEHMAGRYLEIYRKVEEPHRAGAPERTTITSFKPRILMLAPLPPLTGGMAAVADNLRNSALSKLCRLTAINTGKTTAEGRPLLVGIKAQLQLLARIICALLRERTQALHMHTCQFFSFWRDCVYFLVAKCLGCRVLWHVHGSSFDEWAAGMGSLRRSILKFAFERSSGVIILSGGWLARLRQYAPRASWYVLPNGIPMPSKANDVTGSEPVFLFLGDWTRRKGVHDLVAATEAACRDEFHGRVHLAGFEKEPGQLKAVADRVTQGTCGSVIRVLGCLTGKAKEEVLAAADCLVLPSYAEGLPIAILEAMAHGIPVIATTVGAIPEVITDGEQGFLIEPGDVQALTECMLKLSNDPELRKTMGLAARRRVEEEFSIDTMVERVMAVYREVLNERSRC